ncbi:MAG: sigma factor-like helix-turn-helix DNA-binding protein [Ginsengibacter sp.]
MPLTHEDHYYTGFRNGDEKAFEYVYARYYRPLYRHGYEIIDDEFAVNCIVNEAFLKGWKFREQMENMRHIYCFIRQNVKWKCYTYLKNPTNRFHRMLAHPEYLSNLPGIPGSEKEEHQLADKKLKAIEEALPYLPGNRQTIMTLYFKYGYSCKRIARRFGTTNQAISLEVKRSLESLRKMVHAQKRLNERKPPMLMHAQKKLNERKPLKSWRHLNTEGMDEQTRQVFTMRYVEKQEFATIAQKLGIPLARVQQHYVMAHRKIKEILTQ